jgi:hypothetical protein
VTPSFPLHTFYAFHAFARRCTVVHRTLPFYHDLLNDALTHCDWMRGIDDFFLFFLFVCFEIPRCLPLVSDVHSLLVLPGGEPFVGFYEDEDEFSDGDVHVKIYARVLYAAS